MKTVVIILPASSNPNERDVLEGMEDSIFENKSAVRAKVDFDLNPKESISIVDLPTFMTMLNEDVLITKIHWFTFVRIKY